MAYRDRFERRPSVLELRQRTQLHIAQQARVGNILQPVLPSDERALAHTFWGQAWCAQLEEHADFASRLPRGRSYVKHGAVVDLRLQPGCIVAQVLGSDLYNVRIAITPLPAQRWQMLVQRCHGQVESLLDLLQGRLSHAVLRALTDPHEGVLPLGRDMSMTCSCPDGAQVCKHIAAVFYAVGARLDSDPPLLFTLRDVDARDLMDNAGQTLDTLPPMDARLRGVDLGALFDIDLEE